MAKRPNMNRNMIFALLMVVLITAMLAVPIFAKPGKQVLNNPKFSDDSDSAVNETDGTIELVGVDQPVQTQATAKGKSKQSVKHNIKLDRLFAKKTAGTDDTEASGEQDILFEKVDNKMKVHLPPGQETKEQARIKINDVSGEEIAELIAEFEGELTDSETSRVEKGQASLRSIKSLRLVSKEKELSINDSKGKNHRIKAHVNVGLNSINEDSSLDITTSNDLDEDVDKAFEDLAKNKKLKLNNRGGVMKVDKINLKNGEEVENAVITFKVEPEWVGEDNVNDVRILRYDEGYSEVLQTEMVGVDEEGLLIFEGESENGLSTFAVFMTENITDVEDTSFDFGKYKAFLLPLLILVTVGAAFVSSFMRKEQ